MYYDYYLYHLSYLFSLYNGYPLIIRMTVVMVTLLAILVLVSLVRLLYIGYKVKVRETRKQKVRDFFEDKLMFLIKSRTVYELEEVHKLLQYESKGMNSWKGEMLTDIILTVKETLNKEGTLNIINYKNCLESLRIMGFWEKRMRRSGLHKRTEALQILGQINNGVNIGTLSKSTFHKDKHLRKIARELYTEYDIYNPFKFMEDNFDESFTSLDKLRLHSTLIKRDKESKLPNLLRWVNSSKNPEYIIFVIKEIAFFKQYETVPTLIMMLDRQENKSVRAQIIQTIGELGNEEHVPDLIERYSLESNLVREVIIAVMGKIKCEVSFNFLISSYSSSDDVNFKILIARSIRQHGERGLEVLHELQSNVSTVKKEGTLLKQVLSEQAIPEI